MALYDTDGTVNYEWKGVAETDNTVIYPQNKMHDTDGTTTYEIFSGEECLFDNGDNPSLSGGWALSYSSNGGSFSMNTLLNLQSNARVENGNFVPISKYSGIVVTGECMVSNIGSGVFGRVSLLNQSGVSLGYQFITPTTTSVWMPFEFTLNPNQNVDFQVSIQANVQTSSHRTQLRISKIRLIER